MRDVRDFAIIGAAESNHVGVVSRLSAIGLLLEAAGNAMSDAELKPSDIDGLTTGYMPVANVAQLLGIRPKWADSTVVGGCSWQFQLRNAMAAIAAGYCTTVLITHGESGRSHQIPLRYDINVPGSTEQQFSMPFASDLRAALFALPLVRYMRETGLTSEMLAEVVVAQRQWAARNPRATLREEMTVAQVLESPMVAWPLTRAMCCLISDAGGAIIVTSADRAIHLARRPVYVLGIGAAIDAGICCPVNVRDPLRPEFIAISGRAAFEMARMSPSDINHLMIYDAFAHTPLFALEGLGFVEFGAAGGFVKDGNTRPGGDLPMNTNGGGLCYAHSGSYGMLCMLESIRQLRGEAAAQCTPVQTSLVHGWGGFWSACATTILSSEPARVRA